MRHTVFKPERKRHSRTIATVMMLAALGACNTMEGVGEDVEAAGDKIEDSAEKHNNYEHRNR